MSFTRPLAFSSSTGVTFGVSVVAPAVAFEWVSSVAALDPPSVVVSSVGAHGFGSV